jgi:pyrimidine operon attenuation protein/uracil phosphoribosyltransferase
MRATKRIIMTAQELDLALQRIALQILEKNHSTGRLAVVGIHTCGVYLADRLRAIIARQTGAEVLSGSLDITLYRDDWSLISQNPQVKTTDIPFAVEQRDILLVDDVIFTGRTIRAAMDALMDYGRPHSIHLAVLVDRGGRELPIQPDYVGMTTDVLGNERIQVMMQENAGIDQVVIES